MSRKMIYTLSLVMAIATAAMIWVQIMTINKMADLQIKNFDIDVNRTLTEVVDFIDQKEVEQFVKQDAGDEYEYTSSFDFYPNSDPAISLNRLGEKGEITVVPHISEERIQNGKFGTFKALFQRPNSKYAQFLRKKNQ